jgi:hypothetical protein
LNRVYLEKKAVFLYKIAFLHEEIRNNTADLSLELNILLWLDFPSSGHNCNQLGFALDFVSLHGDFVFAPGIDTKSDDGGNDNQDRDPNQNFPLFCHTAVLLCYYEKVYPKVSCTANSVTVWHGGLFKPAKIDGAVV